MSATDSVRTYPAKKAGGGGRRKPLSWQRRRTGKTRMAGSAGLIELVRAAALSAGTTILEIYAQPFAVQQKADASPVTLADQLAEAAIAEALRRPSPDIPIIAEELAAAGHLPAAAPARFWLVDPLDGTKEFIRRNG